MNRRDAVAVLVSMAASPFGACSPRVPTIAFDRDSCTFCRMTISDRRFGAIARTAGGRLERFDSIECLARWAANPAKQATAFWLVDAASPGAVVALEEAEIRRTIRSPMGARGRGFVALRRGAPADAGMGEVVDWATVRKEVAS